MDEEKVFDVVRRCTLDVLPEVEPAAVRPDGSLRDLGANSIDRVDIVTQAMDELGVAVPVTEFQDVRDIRSLVALLQRYA